MTKKVYTVPLRNAEEKSLRESGFFIHVLAREMEFPSDTVVWASSSSAKGPVRTPALYRGYQMDENGWWMHIFLVLPEHRALDRWLPDEYLNTPGRLNTLGRLSEFVALMGGVVVERDNHDIGVCVDEERVARGRPV